MRVQHHNIAGAEHQQHLGSAAIRNSFEFPIRVRMQANGRPQYVVDATVLEKQYLLQYEVVHLEVVFVLTYQFSKEATNYYHQCTAKQTNILGFFV